MSIMGLIFRKITKFSLLLAVIFSTLALSYNSAANWHYHLSSDGIAVKHAHPFDKQELPARPFADHHHSDLELFIIAQLSQIITTGELLLVLTGLLVFAAYARLYFKRNFIVIAARLFRKSIPRSPPIFC